ncbi:ATP-binding cassette domain-containing protein [Verrucosispora sp. WMMD703]|uniref:ATP-binding cassette domain-containing protein n=1 Tax=Verrucosispora sp. WMMD703 TaxID=3403463 RepID=UPI003B9596B5
MRTLAGEDRLLFRVVRDGGGWTVTLVVVALGGAAAELALPAVLGLAVDAAVGGDASPRWPVVACALVVILLVTDVLGDLAGGYGAARATARLRRRLLRHLFALDVRAVGRFPVGDLVGRLAGQAADTGQAGTAVALGGIAVLPPLGSVVALFLLEPVLGLTLLTGLAVLTVLMATFVTDASAVITAYQRVLGTIAGRLQEALGGSRTIAAAGTSDAEGDRVLAALPELRDHGRLGWRLLARANARVAAVAPLLQVAVVAVGGYALSVGWLTPGQLVAAVQYAALGAGLGAVLATLNRLVRSRAAARRIAEPLSCPVRPGGDEPLPPGGGHLRLRGVGVHADDRPVLDAVDLDVPAGCTVAVVGRSGAGKSALAAVAGRLYDPDTGAVLLDGVPLTRLDRAALRRAVGHAFDRPVLVGETVHDAIGLGLPERKARPPSTGAPATAAVLAAARAAQVDGVVARLPDGFRTRTVDAPLSGGEAQRLGLARAFHAERLLILDDATSSLDTATEHRITRALTGRNSGRTRLVVTHRVTTAAAADLVAWLDAGRLRALAPHRRLWADPDYRAVFAGDGVPR